MQPSMNGLHGVNTPKERNFLDKAQAYKLTAELDKNRETYTALTLAVATARLRTLLGFVLTENNVRVAADVLELTFKAASPQGTSAQTALFSGMARPRGTRFRATTSARSKPQQAPSTWTGPSFTPPEYLSCLNHGKRSGYGLEAVKLFRGRPGRKAGHSATAKKE